MNRIEPKTLPGFMELNPDDQILFNNMMKVITDTYIQYGFWPLDTPIIEYSEVLLAKAGGETEKQIYRFNKGDTDLSLRFDLTVPLAKYVAQKYNELVFPFKRYQVGKVYRGERPQKGRFREFYQCDIDVIGDGKLSILYDAEIPSIIYDIFRKLNIGKFVIRINNRKILNGFFEYLNLNDYFIDILRIIDKIDKIGIEETKVCLEEIINDQNTINKIIAFITIKGTNEEILEKLENMKILNSEFEMGLSELKTVINNLKMMDINNEYISIDLSIARGLDYYTGTVYETILTDYPNIGSVCSGGRYDNLAQYYTDKKLPGVGISIGLTRLFYQLKEAGIIKKANNSCADIVILPMNINDNLLVYKTASILRNIGKRVSICNTDSKFKSKMKYSDNCHANFSAIIGEDEIKENYITIKNMINGNQEKVEIENLEKYFINNKF